MPLICQLPPNPSRDHVTSGVGAAGWSLTNGVSHHPKRPE